jgi:dTDP-4-dehydrorhamnose reductase
MTITTMLTIFVIGSTSMIGRYIVHFLTEKGFRVTPMKQEDYDITTTSLHTINNMFTSMNITSGDIVINCEDIIPKAGGDISSIDTFAANALFPVILDARCDQVGCPFIHISTNDVFSGRGSRGYLESDISDETSEYGVSKSLGERHFGTIIRASVIGEERSGGGSFLAKICSQQGGTVYGFTNHLWNGVTCLQLAKIIYQIIMRGGYWGGVRHIFSPHTITNLELVTSINTLYKLDNTIIECSAPIDINRTLSTTLTNPIVEFGIPDIQYQLIEQQRYTFL